jgi:hypothetical protein
LLAIVAAAALAGCSNQDQNVAAEENSADANAGVELPPSIADSKTYRCGDNTIVHVDWMSDNKTANVRVGEGPATILTAAEPGQPMTGGAGFSLTGTASEPSISLTTPDHGKQSCKA